MGRHHPVDIGIEGVETRPLGQKGAAADAVGEGGVTALQEGDGRFDRRQVALEVFQEAGYALAAARCWQCLSVGAHGFEPVTREQPQHQRQRQVFLQRVEAARSQEAGEVSGGRIGRVELRHRRDDGEDAQTGIGHWRGSDCMTRFLPRTAVGRARAMPCHGVQSSLTLVCSRPSGDRYAMACHRHPLAKGARADILSCALANILAGHLRAAWRELRLAGTWCP